MKDVDEVTRDIIRHVIFTKNTSLLSCILQSVYLALFLICHDVSILYYFPGLWCISILMFAMNFVRNRKFIQQKMSAFKQCSKNIVCCRVIRAREPPIKINDAPLPTTNMQMVQSNSNESNNAVGIDKTPCSRAIEIETTEFEREPEEEKNVKFPKVIKKPKLSQLLRSNSFSHSPHTEDKPQTLKRALSDQLVYDNAKPKVYLSSIQTDLDPVVPSQIFGIKPIEKKNSESFSKFPLGLLSKLSKSQSTQSSDDYSKMDDNEGDPEVESPCTVVVIDNDEPSKCVLPSSILCIFDTITFFRHLDGEPEQKDGVTVPQLQQPKFSRHQKSTSLPIMNGLHISNETMTGLDIAEILQILTSFGFVKRDNVNSANHLKTQSNNV